MNPAGEALVKATADMNSPPLCQMHDKCMRALLICLYHKSLRLYNWHYLCSPPTPTSNKRLKKCVGGAERTDRTKASPHTCDTCVCSSPLLLKKKKRFVKSCISIPFYTNAEHETRCLIGTAFVFMSEPLFCLLAKEEKWRDRMAANWDYVYIQRESVSRMTADHV